MKFREVCKVIHEEMAANAVGHGKIAGTAEAGDDPVIRKNKKAIMTFRKGLMKRLYGGRNER